jgi:hypothetical protein
MLDLQSKSLGGLAIVDMALSFVLFALTIRTHCARTAMQNQDHNASGGKTRIFAQQSF